MPYRYYEDFSVGQVISGKQYYEVTKEEIIEFARKWDPFPFHTDEKAARASIFKGLTAPAVMVIAISSWLWHSVDGKPAMVAGLGWEKVQFLKPARPGDRLSIKFECVDVRSSESKPDCGIVSTRVTVTNQRGEAVLTLLDSYLVQRRGKGSATNSK